MKYYSSFDFVSTTEKCKHYSYYVIYTKTDAGYNLTHRLQLDDLDQYVPNNYYLIYSSLHFKLFIYNIIYLLKMNTYSS